ASDLVLQLSRKPEAFGRTVIEALSAGRPVLGWAHGGVGELLSTLQPAGAVAPFDADALAVAAARLLADPPSPVAVPYTLQAMQQATLDLYAELAGCALCGRLARACVVAGMAAAASVPDSATRPGRDAD